MKRHKITLLDLGGVVFQSTGTSNHKINWQIISKLNYKYGYDLNIGRDLFPAFLEEYNLLSKQLLTGEVFLKEVFDTLELNTELIEMIRGESEIMIVSDNYRENIEYISKRYNFGGWAIGQFYSFNYGMVKSDPEFFKMLLDDVKDYEAREMILIDDSIEKVESAEKSGIKGLLYRSNDQIRKELEKYNS